MPALRLKQSLRMSIKAYVLDVRYERAIASDVTERVLEDFASRGWREFGTAG